MDRVYQANASVTPVLPPSPGANGFVQSDIPLPLTVTDLPTTPGPFFYQYVTESLLAVIAAAGLTYDATNLHQLRDSIKALAAAANVDPFFANVVLLLHFNGINGSHDFIDSSSKMHVPSNVFGSANLDTSIVKFGASSGSFVGGYVWYADSDDWDMTDQDFTVETWVRFDSTAMGKRNGLFAQADFAGGNHTFAISKTDTDHMQCVAATTGLDVLITGTSTVVDDVWYHMAMVRSAGTLTLYRDGIVEGSAAISGPIPPQSWHFGVGVLGEYTNSVPPAFGTMLIGWLDDLRITKGVARYTGVFSPPSRQFPDRGPA